MHKRVAAVLSLTCVSLYFSESCSSEKEIRETRETLKLDVRWGGTPSRLLEEMFRYAKIEKDDIIYDLGCGDGRIVISAAKKYGIKGVGIDLDPIRIMESEENLQRSGLRSQVKFFCQNLFDVDISEATVLAIYLNKKVNRRLRPKIFREMKPGSRIVSHNWDMGNWKPDAITKIENRTVYYWMLPVNVSGEWSWTLPNDPLHQKYELKIEQFYQKGKGYLGFHNLKALIKNISVTGNKILISYEESIGADKFNISYEGILAADTITGKATIKSGQAIVEETWHAIRKPVSITDIIEADTEQ